MSIIKDGRERQLECDGCPATTDPFDHEDFQLMIDTAKRDGWQITSQNGEWSHICPDCKSTAKLDRARALFS
jgi:Fe2+ or Zn2+ uptake regulation protein